MMASAYTVLMWLETHAAQITVQQIAPAQRRKNRCILQYRDRAGALHTVGGRDLADAVSRARVRYQTIPASNGLAIAGAEPGPESIGSFNEGIDNA
jgi:hypothetical protein